MGIFWDLIFKISSDAFFRVFGRDTFFGSPQSLTWPALDLRRGLRRVLNHSEGWQKAQKNGKKCVSFNASFTPPCQFFRGFRLFRPFLIFIVGYHLSIRDRSKKRPKNELIVFGTFGVSFWIRADQSVLNFGKKHANQPKRYLLSFRPPRTCFEEEAAFTSRRL